MNATVTAPAASRAVTLAARVADLLPERAGSPWTVEPYGAWWSAKPAARLVQDGRALIVVAHTWRTEIGWQLPDREPYEPDLRIERMAPEPIARDVLRLVLPVVDDEAARRAHGGPRVMGRLELLNEIGHAVRLQGLATYNRVGLLVNTSTLAWGAPSGLRYSVTLHGTNPACDVQIEGPVRALERAITHFMPEAAPARPEVPLVRGRLQRRMAAFLARYGDVEQTDTDGLAFGNRPGPYGCFAPAFDSAARAHDSAPASVDLHGVGVDFLVSLAPHLAR
ncbi:MULTISPECIES: hypothetical protein [unclassified Streptomyces]|uniref:hypothetical protein n=1 Tax=unclassified Streptomyces TaxID=2593676 RepID=UPI0022519A39|nr:MULTISPECIES: hypothetical protein [unclassified Streptomyces]MCX4976500.1 hypothetical protein [Streptomyces sp. NBC_00620]WRZ24369.1 hypothetical protein OHT59_40575 [Streptomyces sp. NBC_00243]